MGVYDNSPLVRVESRDRCGGMCVDLLRSIANMEGWRVRYVPGSWSECLGRLERGEIDLLVAIAFTQERNKRFDFTEFAVLNNWGQIFLPPGSTIGSFFDLKGRRVAVLKDDIHTRAFADLLAKFEINEIRLVEVDSYAEVFSRVASGQAAAGVANRVFGLLNARSAAVVPSPLVFNPIEIHYAAPAGRNGDLLAAIDRHLEVLKGDRHSLYYELFDKTFPAKSQLHLPGWIVWLVAGIGLSLVMALSGVFVFKLQLKRKTAELIRSNDFLQEEISTRCRLEQDLVENEKQLQAIFDQAAVGVALVHTPSGELLRMNRKYCAIIGYSLEEMKTLSFRKITHPDDLEEDLRQKELFRQGRIREFSLEKRYLHRDGRYIWVSLTVTPLGTSAGKPENHIAVVVDITPRKTSELALKSNEKQFRGLVENIPGAVFRSQLHPPWRAIHMSEGMEKLTGYPALDFREGRVDFGNLIHESDLERVGRMVASAVSNRKPYEVEYRLRHREGYWCWVSERGRAEYDENQEPLWLDGVIIDITAEKKAEEEKIRLEEQLRQSHKMEAIGTLAGGIAHDFNNLLAIILGYAEMARDDIPQWSRAREDIAEIVNAGNRARDLVGQILTFSRKSEQKKVALEIDLLVKETMKLMRSTIPATIEINTDIEPRCGSISADPTQIHQVLVNLCTNAAQAMDENGGVLTVRLGEHGEERGHRDKTPELGPGRYVHLSVSDTGSGIPKDVLNRIFDPYFTTKEVGKGSGMGLAVVHGIVKAHQGVITVETEEQRGSTFHVFFPRIETVSPEEEPLRPGLVNAGSGHLLVVDDEEGLRAMLARRLTRLGYRVTTRGNGVEALELFRSRPGDFDLIITDQTMPRLTGSGLALAVKEIRPDIPVILCTGYSAKIDEQKAGAMGIEAFLLKPLDNRELAATVRRLLDGEEVSLPEVSRQPT